MTLTAAPETTSGPALENPFAGQGAVVLDIGGEVGALVVVMPADMVAVEVEARVTGKAGASQHHHAGEHHAHSHAHAHDHAGDAQVHHPHVAVVARPTPDGGTVPSLVFPALVQGSYELHVKDTDEVRLVAEIRGGEVTEVAWR